jgi:RNA polymerase-binding transcription factor DksA
MRKQSEKKDVDYQPFTIEDVQQVLEDRINRESVIKRKSVSPKTTSGKTTKTNISKSSVSDNLTRNKEKKSASILDILGFDPSEKRATHVTYDHDKVPKKWKKYFDQLLCMRDELESRISSLTKDTLAQGDVGGTDAPNMLGQHLADGAAQQVDMDLALSFVATEHELLNEVNNALERIFAGTYGVCQQTGEPINAKRLEVLPFAKFSLKGQEEFERLRKEQQQTQRSSAIFIAREEADTTPPDDVTDDE